MRQFENSLFQQGIKHIAGLDEAGRGPLAGPVVAAAVVFPEEISIEGVRDSKKISAARREKLYPIIFEKALSVGVGIISEQIIDRINILEATRTAMAQAVDNLSICPEHLLIDGNFRINNTLPQTPIVRGDSLSLSIAAASIIAKVTRDRLMQEIDDKHPEYLFRKHKGYGTQAHLSMIKKYGPCKVHRKTFKGVKEWIRPNE